MGRCGGRGGRGKSGGKGGGKGAGKAKAYTYVMNLKGGKKYVGMTQNPKARMDAHFSGRGSAVTKQYAPKSAILTPHRSVQAAKAAETRVYHEQKAIHGKNNVRGAGNTARF